MNDYKININYAKALFLIAADQQVLPQAFADMQLVNEVCRENHVLCTVFANPTVPEAKKVAILNDLFQERLSKVSLAFLAFVVRKRRAVNLAGISNAFLQLYRDENNIVLSSLTTHAPVDQEARDAVARLIADYTGKQVELEAKTDPNMLGGFAMSFNNNMYDARIRTKIAKLRAEFSKNTYESKL